MPVKQSQHAEVNNFIGGLITEASPLNFPPNSALDITNFELNRNGTLSKRLGMTLPVSIRETNIPTNTGFIFSSFVWKGVAGDRSREFLVVQYNNNLDFFDLQIPDSIANGFMGSLNNIALSIDNRPYSFTSVNGLLVVVSGDVRFMTVSYSLGLGFTESYDFLKTRDVWGIEEDASYENNPDFNGPYTDKHYYNLCNQSWGKPRLWVKSRGSSVATETVDPSLKYLELLGRMPSDSEQVWSGMIFQPAKDEIEDQQAASPPIEVLDINLLDQNRGTKTKVARGSLIIDVVDRGVSRGVALSDLLQRFRELGKYPSPLYFINPNVFPKDASASGPSIVAEFAGRVFFAGFDGELTQGDKRSPSLGDHVFFSTLVKGELDIRKCYQIGDPTSREESDVIDTDGGFIRVSGAKNIVSLANLGENLAIIAENGVWVVSGGSQYGFSATNYKVTKVSAFGCTARSSVVVAGSNLYFLSDNGIYLLGPDKMGDMNVTNISLNTIQTFYNNIEATVKRAAVGIFDEANQKIRWTFAHGNFAYGDDLPTTPVIPDESTTFSLELILDLPLGAFYKHKLPGYTGSLGFSGFIVGGFPVPMVQIGTLQEEVIHSNETVVDGIDNVFVVSDLKFSASPAVKYIVLQAVNSRFRYGFGEYKDVSFTDFGEEPVDAYLVTGQTIAGDSSVFKQAPYITINMKRTETGIDPSFNLINPSGCTMQFYWDYQTQLSGAQYDSFVDNRQKWTSPQQVYRLRKFNVGEGPGNINFGYDVVSTKSKIRGRGKSFAMSLLAEQGKDCQILGWNLSVNGNAIT